jgi:hypothetical protein
MGSGASDQDPMAEMHIYWFVDWIRSEPLDLDPGAQIRRYRFGLAVFLNRPWFC